MLEHLSCTIVRLAVGLERLQDALLVDPPGRVGRYAAGQWTKTIGPDVIAGADDERTYLKRLMRSSISSCETSGYFLRSLNASMAEGGMGEMEEMAGVAWAAAADVVSGYMHLIAHCPVLRRSARPLRLLPLPTALCTAASPAPSSACCAPIS